VAWGTLRESEVGHVGTGPRILAITESASLVIGLTFWPADWEVASQPTPEDVGDADLLVIDLGDTAAGVAALDRCRADGVACPAVVIGNQPAAVDLPGQASLLLRPYSLDDLAARIDELLQGAAGSSAGVPAAGQPGDRSVAVPADELSTPEREDGPGTAIADVPSAMGEPAGDGEETTGTRSVERLFGRLAGRAPPARSEDGSVTVPDGDGRDGDRSASVGEVGPDVILDLTELEPRAGGSPQPDTGSLGGPGSGLPRPATPVSSAPTKAPPRPLTDALAAAQRAARPVPVAGATAATVAATPRPSRWFARKQRRVSAAEQDLRERLVRVLAATTELERLIDEVPLLADLPGLAAVVVEDLAARLRADTVGLWRHGELGWAVTAHHGLTKHEATWVVSDEQPMFAEVHHTGGSLLIDPVEPVQAAVAGIGGAHTESFMATSVAVGPGRYGILAVGRDDPLTVDDLDTLAEVALEMAPGLAVAEQIERLRATARPPEPEPPAKRSWHR
jgi:hypothetical protein